VEGSRESGDEPSGSSATELVLFNGTWFAQRNKVPLRSNVLLTLQVYFFSIVVFFFLDCLTLCLDNVYMLVLVSVRLKQKVFAILTLANSKIMPLAA
jgi:hypothetical protein